MALQRRTTPPASQEIPSLTTPSEPRLPAHELVIESKTGRVRQAGADMEGAEVVEFRQQCERSLYAFAKGILRRDLLSPRLHGWFCQSLQSPPPYRKLRLMPRGHLKSSIVSEAMPLHMLIQPDPEEGKNSYWPGLSGADMRILLAGEKQDLMASHLRWIETQCESNNLLRGLWPQRFWQNPRRDAKKWNEVEMLIPRKNDYADPSIRVIGVGGAITGAHPNVLVKDDLISVEAANSPTVMQTAIEWHKASRALLAPNEERGLEYIIGTRWAVSDLYSHIMQTDPSVDCITRSIVEDGVPIWPEQISLKHVSDLRKEYGSLFHLLYMNNAGDPELTDFPDSELRYYTIDGENLIVEEDDRDLVLHDREKAPDRPSPDGLRGTPLTPEVYALEFSGREEYFRFKTR